MASEQGDGEKTAAELAAETPTQTAAEIAAQSGNAPGERTLSWFEATMILVNTIVGTGIFTLPAYSFKSVGTVGLYMLLWPIGGLYAFCGYLCWLELGLGIPRSGGEKNYLERIYRNPKGLGSMVFMVLTIVLYTSSPNAVSFGRYLLYVCGDMRDGWAARGIAAGVMTGVSLIHTFLPGTGRFLMKWLGVAKILMLAAMILMGFLCLGGALKPEGNPKANFKNAFSPPLHPCVYNQTMAATDYCKDGGPKVEGADPAGFAHGLMNIIFAFAGWNSANMVLGEIKNPNRSMKIAGVASISIVTTVYMLANIALFSAIPAYEIMKGDLLIAGVMFQRATGHPSAARAAAAFVALSNLGNVFSFSFSMARLVQEYARSKMLPKMFGWTSRGSPAGGYLLHWFFSMVLIVGPPPGSAYNFLINVPTFAIVLMTLLVAAGLLNMRLRPATSNWSSPFRCPLYVVGLFIAYCLFLVIAPWVPRRSDLDRSPARKKSDLPWYLGPTCSIAVLAFGTICWFAWARAYPRYRGLVLVEREKVSDDGHDYTEFTHVPAGEAGLPKDSRSGSQES